MLLLNLILLCLASASAASIGGACQYRQFPVFAGGSKDEEALCSTVDKQTGYIYVGGHTLSPDFGPNLTQHGYLFALNQESFWMWGNYYSTFDHYNITTITGVSVSSHNSHLAAMVISNLYPSILILDKLTGAIKKFFYITTRFNIAATYTSY